MRASLIVLAAVLSSCSTPLVDLSSFDVDTWPSSANQVLAAGDTVRVTFSDPVERTSAQTLLAVSSVDGVVPGDLSWSGRTLTFTPVPALVPSKRYDLEFSGQVTLSDGRRFTIVKQVPFFSQYSSAGLSLASYSPANGATATTVDPLVLTFSQSVDAVAFTAGFSVSPTVGFTATWSGGGTTVTIVPLGWTANTVVSWQLSELVKSSTGLPLVAAVNRSFVTNADQVPPYVVNLLPAVPSGSGTVTWLPVGPDLNSLVKGDGLLLTVSEPVRLSTLSAALHLTPTVKGHWQAQSTAAAPYEYVFIPDDDWAPGTSYSLQLSEVQDEAGNAMPTPYLTSFTPAIPYLKVVGVTLTGTGAATYSGTDLNHANFFPTCVPSGVSGALQIAVTLAFDAPFSAADKAQFALISFCQPLFPTDGVGLATPTLVTVSFAGDSTAVLTYQGFAVNTPAAPNYYRIRVPGGSSGLKTQAGNTLKEEVWLNFATGS